MPLRSVFLVVALLGACNRPVPTGAACTADSECGLSQRCDVDTGRCLCVDDSACDGATEFCNEAGRCQPKNGCVSNDDCAQGGATRVICDTTSSTCTALTAAVGCFLDSHCPFGSWCSDGQCAPGCRDNGDCMIGDPCIAGVCDGREGVCNEDSYCDYGDFCDDATGTCRSHPDKAQLCSNCNPTDCDDDDDCGAGGTCVGASFFGPGQCSYCDNCLIDDQVAKTSCTSDAQCPDADAMCYIPRCLDDGDCFAGGNCGNDGRCDEGVCSRFFCGNDECDETPESCPRGYNCYQLYTVAPNNTCDDDGDCAQGASCSISAESAAGSCSCLSDNDCPIIDNFGTRATCVQPGPGGACITGTTCGPQPGLSCEVLR